MKHGTLTLNLHAARSLLLPLIGIAVMLLLCVAGCQGEGADESADDGGEQQNDEEKSDVTHDTGSDDRKKPGTPSADENGEDNQTPDTETETKAQPLYRVNPNHFRLEAVDESDEQKVALLTFDDTPAGEHTGRILDILDEYGAKAIFFVNGHYAVRYPELLADIHERGHLIGNHTWWHIRIRQEDPETVREEIVGLNEYIEEQTGVRPVYFRPPFGQNSDVSLDIIRREGMQTMNWSNGSLDWEFSDPAQVTEQVLNNMHDGANILFHDKKVTANALEDILSALTAEGYAFVLPTEVILPGEPIDDARE